jgi:hypothetical protein
LLAGGLRWQACVSFNYLNFRLRKQKRVSCLCLLGSLIAGLPLPVQAGVSASLNWVASSDPSVIGYTIYYGGASHQYTNSVMVGNVTNATISGLAWNTAYFFAATAQDNSGTQSAFSNETAFEGVNAAPNEDFRLKITSDVTNNDPLVYSLGAGAPAGVTINATNGIIAWTPGLAYASTTNYINVIVTDTANLTLSTSETLAVVVTDYLSCQLGCTAVYAGQSGSLPLNVVSSGTVTNVQVALNWPGAALGSPTLTFYSPVVSGSLQNQNGQLVIQLQTAASQPLTGTNLAAQINFQSVSGQPSAILSIPVSATSGNTASGTAYVNTVAQAGEVVVVGPQTIMRPYANAATGRTLSLYASPGTYQLVYTTCLAAPGSWKPLLTYQQTNAVQSIALDSSNPVVFYRLQPM